MCDWRNSRQAVLIYFTNMAYALGSVVKFPIAFLMSSIGFSTKDGFSPLAVPGPLGLGALNSSPSLSSSASGLCAIRLTCLRSSVMFLMHMCISMVLSSTLEVVDITVLTLLLRVSAKVFTYSSISSCLCMVLFASDFHLCLSEKKAQMEV